MTTIAWDGKTLATDSRISGQNEQMFSRSKIDVWYEHELKCQFYFAYAGNLPDCFKLYEFLRYGKDFNFCQDSDRLKVNGILIKKKIKAELIEVFYADDTGVVVPIVDQFISFGTGSAYAMGAMAAGAHAVRAVEIASIYDAHTGGKINSVRIL